MRRTLVVLLLLKGLLLIGLSPAVFSAETLRVGLSADYPPLHYKHEGRIVGMEPDNAVSIGKILDRKIELVELSFEELIPAL